MCFAVNVKISDRMSSLNPSAIREMFKMMQKPGMISFTAGSPSEAEFPVGELRALADRIFAERGAAALKYGVTEGYGPLREQIAERMKSKYGVGRENVDDLIVVSGGQQCIDLAAKCLLNEGDTVVCENPSFVGALNAFRSYGARLAGVPMDEGGMDMEALEQALRTEKTVRLIYTIPTFQNPMGVTLAAERRRRLYELAVKYDVMVLEDAPYFELRYSGDPVPAIKSMDETGRVLFSGSFSKVVAPGIRVGFACGHKNLISKMVVAKQGADVHTNLFFQMLLSDYLKNCDLDGHIRECCDHYRIKRDRMLERMETLFPDGVKFTRPEGGIFIWCRMPEGFSGEKLCALAAERGVAVVPGYTFDPAEDRNNSCFRLNFTVPSLEEIDRGVDILSGCLKDMLK